MLRAGSGHAEGTDTLYITRQALARAQADLGRRRPRAALVFAGAEYDHAAMLAEIGRRYPGIELAGCTAAGEFSSNLGLSEYSINILLIASDAVDIRAGLGENASQEPRRAALEALKGARANLERVESLCLAFPDGAPQANSELLAVLNAELAADCPVFGGAAARHPVAPGAPKQFCGERVVEGGVALLLFSGPVRCAFSSADGGTELPVPRLIEEARRSAASVPAGFAGPPEAVLVFSSAARQRMLGTRTGSELAAHRDSLPPHTPITGFYGSAALGPAAPGEDCRVQPAGMTTLLLGEGGGGSGPHERPAPAEKEPHGPNPMESLRREKDFLRWKLRAAEYFRKDLEAVRDQDAGLSNELAAARGALAAAEDSLALAQPERDRLLRNFLPAKVAAEFKEKGAASPVFYPAAAVVYTGFPEFARCAREMNPRDLVRELNDRFAEFDRIARRHGLEPLRTAGDSYLCAGGLPEMKPGHILDAVRAAWEMRAAMAARKNFWDIRIGVHAGPLTAGIAGGGKFAYDVWGDAVRIAARLQACCAPGEIGVSLEVYEAVHGEYECRSQGMIAVKCTDGVEMFFVRRKQP